MTLAEVEAQANVPTSYVLEQLGLPQSTSPDERVGQLRRQHSFQMEDLRRIITEYEAP